MPPIAEQDIAGHITTNTTQSDRSHQVEASKMDPPDCEGLHMEVWACHEIVLNHQSRTDVFVLTLVNFIHWI